MPIANYDLYETCTIIAQLSFQRLFGTSELFSVLTVLHQPSFVGSDTDWQSVG